MLLNHPLTPNPKVTPMKQWLDDLRVLMRFVRGKPNTGDHSADLDAFYRPQAYLYDNFRERLLPGREDFMRALPLKPGARVVDFGAGTGRHWLYVEHSLATLERLDLIDLCTPLLEIASERFNHLANVHTEVADAQIWQADSGVDVIVFSYSLSMMTNWQAALANACKQLRPGGVLAIIDFYTLPEFPPSPLNSLSSWNRWFWPRWFAHDGVMLRPQVLPFLLTCGDTLVVDQSFVRLPYLPWPRAPWFMWIGHSDSRFRFNE